MSYREAIENIYAIVANCPRGAEEAPGLPFHTVEGPTEGDVVPVDELPDAVVRQFDVRMADAPQDDGLAGLVWTRFRVSLEVRVRYPARPRAASEVMIGDDVARLINALISPSNHGGAIEAVVPGRPRLEELIGDGGDVIALLLRLPFELIYTAL